MNNLKIMRIKDKNMWNWKYKKGTNEQNQYKQRVLLISIPT